MILNLVQTDRKPRNTVENVLLPGFYKEEETLTRVYKDPV